MLWTLTNRNSVFDPFREQCTQRRTPRDKAVVIIGPSSNLPFLYPRDRNPRQPNWTFSRKPAVEKLRDRILQNPFGDHMLTADKDVPSLHQRIWIQLARFFKELGQPLLVTKLQSDPVVFESNPGFRPYRSRNGCGGQI